MNETQFCERADAVTHLAGKDESDRCSLATGERYSADPDHVFYLSAEQAPPRHAGAVRSREILGW